MKFEVAYPTTEVAGNPDDIRKFIRAAEELGYQHLTAYDHIAKAPHEEREPILTGPYTENHSFHDPFVLFGFAAAVTDKLDFVTGVLCLPQRQTALVAQEAADHLRIFRDAGGTHGCVPSMDKGFGNNINAHIDYIAETKRLLDAG